MNVWMRKYYCGHHRDKPVKISKILTKLMLVDPVLWEKMFIDPDCSSNIAFRGYWVNCCPSFILYQTVWEMLAQVNDPQHAWSLESRRGCVEFWKLPLIFGISKSLMEWHEREADWFSSFNSECIHFHLKFWEGQVVAKIPGSALVWASFVSRGKSLPTRAETTLGKVQKHHKTV